MKTFTVLLNSGSIGEVVADSVSTNEPVTVKFYNDRNLVVETGTIISVLEEK